MTSAFRGVTGADPYTGAELAASERLFEAVTGAAGLVGTAVPIAGSLRTGAGLTRTAAAEFTAAGVGRGVGAVGRSAARGLGRSMADEWSGTLREAFTVKPFAETRLGQSLAGSRLGSALGAADDPLYATGRAIGGKIAEGYHKVAASLDSLTTARGYFSHLREGWRQAPRGVFLGEGAGAFQDVIERAASAHRYARQAASAADDLAATADDVVRGVAQGTGEPLLLTAGNPTARTLGEVRRLRGRARWEAGEQYVQEVYGSAGRRHFAVPETGGRFVDAPVNVSNRGVLANEVKIYQQWRTVKGLRQQSSVPLTEHIRQQVLKDVWLHHNRPGFDPRWIFLDAPPSTELGNFLNQHNITHIIYR
jgi:hypothetical protein